MASTIAKGKVVMAEDTVKSIMLLNKLWIPDVLIDIIKDYLYINTETVLRNYYRACTFLSIERMTVEYSDFTDQLGRTRLTHWAIGHRSGKLDIQFQNIICVTCGESDSEHANIAGCCRLEGDGEEGTLELTEADRLSENENDDYDDDDALFCYSEEEEEDW